MSNKIYASLIVLVAVVVCVERTSAQPTEHFLDLLTVPHVAGSLVPLERGSVAPDQRLGPGGLALPTHVEGPMSPFTFSVRLARLDRGTYASRDPFVYELELRNIGGTPVQFPWSVDASLFDMRVAGGTVAVVSLIDADNKSPKRTITGFMLFGAPSVPGSLETIDPGELVRIRVPSDWMDATEHVVQLRARVIFSLNSRAYPALLSNNRVVVQARGRTPRQ